MSYVGFYRGCLSSFCTVFIGVLTSYYVKIQAMNWGFKSSQGAQHADGFSPAGELCVERFVALQNQLTEQSNTLVDQQDLINKHRQIINSQKARIAILEEQLQLNRAQRFGPSSETDPVQPDFFIKPGTVDEMSDSSQEDPAPKKPKKRANRKKGLNPAIPREQQRVYLSDEQREGAVSTFFESVKEELDITPAKVRVIEYLVEKAVYLDDCGKRKVVAATRVPHPLGKCIASVGLLAYIIIAKFADGMPLYRLEGILKRHGGSIGRSTMASWIIRLAVQLQPVINLLHETQLSGFYLQCDETRLKVLREPGMKPQGHKWMWLLRGGPPDKPVVLFRYDKSRNGEVAKALLDGFEGSYLQCDGYSAYPYAVRGTSVTLLGCFDHSRRKFVEAEVALSEKAKKTGKVPKCTEALSMINTLYRLERQMNEQKLNDEQRTAFRQEHAVPQLETLHEWLQENASKVPPKSLTGKAIRYTLSQWSKLIVYCEHGQLNISNILAENAIRPYVIGRKAFLFCNTPEGANACATFYTLVESAKANGIDPYRYVLHLCRRIATAQTVEDIEALLPWNVKAQLA